VEAAVNVLKKTIRQIWRGDSRVARSTVRPDWRSPLHAALLALLAGALANAAWADDGPGVWVDSTASLVHLGSIDSFDTTEGGITAAKLLLDAIRDGDREAAQKAAAIYKGLIPNENFGGEYTALQWFCNLLTTPEADRKPLLADPLTAEYFAFLGGNNFELLQEFLVRKYRLGKIGDENTFEAVRREAFLQDYILFNNPRRESWEQSSKFIGALGLKPGDRVVDVGCGPGYFTFAFADKVGPDGHVHALDINEVHVKYLQDLVRRSGLKNVSVTKSKLDDIGPVTNADVVWMCSLYHIMYVLASQEELGNFLASISKVLKPDGRLVILDNALVTDSTLPYHGPYIAKELIIEQLRYYGFRLVETQQFIPQRYMLVFQKDGRKLSMNEHQPTKREQ
jgi:ubiquinone/menaquinone biosynthesis C-methylase UbiE